MDSATPARRMKKANIFVFKITQLSPLFTESNLISPLFSRSIFGNYPLTSSRRNGILFLL
jgi:hypothetical protein